MGLLVWLTGWPCGRRQEAAATGSRTQGEAAAFFTQKQRAYALRVRVRSSAPRRDVDERFNVVPFVRRRPGTTGDAAGPMLAATASGN
jgi:hypothetical protein